MKRFQGKTAFVTGAASGIGLATVKRLAEEGAQVYACDINAALLEEEMNALSAQGGAIIARPLDVTDSDACQAAIAEAVARFGKLDVLCNVAGILFFAHYTDMTLNQWNRIIAINLTATAMLCQAAIPHLLKTKGNIVNVASIAASSGLPYNAAYCASKGGVLMLTKALAVEYADRSLRVNAVSPGGVNTPLASAVSFPEGASMDVFGRALPLLPMMAEPADIAGTIAYLASDEARFITGAEMLVDGGTTAI